MESTKKISLFNVVFLGLLTAITPLGTDLYLPALPIMPHELNTNASPHSDDNWYYDFWYRYRSIDWRSA